MTRLWLPVLDPQPLVRVLSAFIKSFIYTVEQSTKLAENMYFGIRIVISNGATKKNMQGG